MNVIPIYGKILKYSAFVLLVMMSQTGNNRHKTIVVSAENYNSLKKLGHVGDSFNDVIGALLSKIMILERKQEVMVNV